ncbi:MAG TPA: hypothetical protein VHQ70_07115 [Syntrophomonadaceae bacterium]|nr:hypothetical protein [Syntrophomonadaceae bacterium]
MHAVTVKPSHLEKTAGPQSVSQVYGLGVQIYELTLESLKMIKPNCADKSGSIQYYIRKLTAGKKELLDYFYFTLNNEISFFYQNKGLLLKEAGQLDPDEQELIIYPILNSYSLKLRQLEEIVKLMDTDNENEVAMICLELADNLYSVFRQLSHLYPIVELRTLFKEMAQMLQNNTAVWISI